MRPPTLIAIALFLAVAIAAWLNASPALITILAVAGIAATVAGAKPLVETREVLREIEVPVPVPAPVPVPESAPAPAPVPEPATPGSPPELAPEPPAPPPRRATEHTAISVSVHGQTRDLQHVLMGIIGDEGGKPVLNGTTIAAHFSGRAHASRAMHAARRLISNADALSAHLERDIRLTIGVASGSGGEVAEEAHRLELLAWESRVPAIFDERSVSLLDSEASMVAPVMEDPERVYGFVPVQTRLPGL